MAGHEADVRECLGATMLVRQSAKDARVHLFYARSGRGYDAATNTQDLLALINALNNGAANLSTNLARYNINRSAGASPVNTQDLLRLIQLLNGTNTTQSFNGAGVAACP